MRRALTLRPRAGLGPPPPAARGRGASPAAQPAAARAPAACPRGPPAGGSAPKPLLLRTPLPAPLASAPPANRLRSLLPGSPGPEGVRLGPACGPAAGATPGGRGRPRRGHPGARLPSPPRRGPGEPGSLRRGARSGRPAPRGRGRRAGQWEASAAHHVQPLRNVNSAARGGPRGPCAWRPAPGAAGAAGGRLGKKPRSGTPTLPVAPARRPRPAERTLEGREFLPDRGHQQAKGRGFRRNRPCQQLDLGRSAPRTVSKYISVVYATPSAALGYGSSGQRLQRAVPFASH
ncbi:translation initiation factor IF-2-like [Pipistrellus kuhlii]|uniref:translation initiation factor IF-2-like n=1 Tax=Pipistrellus kuhlii TaxID=59472 RepID=UPI001E272079|nr:translation initiation factor IF-2-like [Pipistrellus kuhlii]